MAHCISAPAAEPVTEVQATQQRTEHGNDNYWIHDALFD